MSPFNEESTLRVADAIREHKPNVMVTHWNGSWHKDHQNCHLIVHDAIFYAGLATLERKLPPHSAGKVYYPENWEDADKFQADVFLTVEPVYEKWMQATPPSA
jgi:LmbE family N-acetylglucosaminyl deacetylase